MENMEYTITVYVDAESLADAEDIAHDIHEILNNQGITNSTHVSNDDPPFKNITR